MEKLKFEPTVERKILQINPLDSSVQETLFEVSCTNEDGKIFSSKEIKNLSKISWFEEFGIPDAKLTMACKKELLEKLQMSTVQAPVTKRVRVTNSGIYHIYGETYYVVGNRIFKKKPVTDDGIEVIIDDNLQKSYMWRDTYEEWQRKYNPNMRVIEHVTSELAEKYMNVCPKCSEILFFTTLCAAIKPIFIEAGQEPYLNFMVNVYGRSGSYKTSLVKAITAITDSSYLLGSYTVGKKQDVLKNHLNATGFVYVVDDYHVQASDYGRKRQKDILNGLVRQAETVKQAGMVVTSAEYLDGIFSTQDRCLQIEIQDVDIELLTKIQKFPQIMSTIVYRFIEVIMANYEEVVEKIPILFNSFDKEESGIRAYHYTKILKVVAELYRTYLCNDEVSHRQLRRLNEALDYQISIQKIHLEHMRELEIEGGEIGVVRKILCRDIYAMHTSGEYSYQYNELLIKSDKCICMTMQALQHGLNTYFGGRILDAKKVARHLLVEGILDTDNSGDPTKQFFHKRVLFISRPALDSYCLVNLDTDEHLMKLIKRKRKLP